MWLTIKTKAMNSVILNVVIGLVFIYLLYSLLATIIQELIASWFGFRAKILELAIFRMLEDESKFRFRFESLLHIFRKSKQSSLPTTPSAQFYNHPLIKFLGEGKQSSKPSYINRETFSKVIIDLLRSDTFTAESNPREFIQTALNEGRMKWGEQSIQISPETLSYLRSLWADAQGDVVQFRKSLEGWFDETMDRVTGWYKKHTQFILLIVGFIIAVAFNVDTIKIVTKLERDPVLRQQVVQQASAFMRTNPNLEEEMETASLRLVTLQTTTSTSDTTRAKIKIYTADTARYKALMATRDSLVSRADSLINADLKKVNSTLGIGLSTYSCGYGINRCFFQSLLGWLITALAISLGAPFWFDLLNKLMKLRNSVSTASTAAAPTSNAPQTTPTERKG